MTNNIAKALAELSREDVATLTATMEEFSWRESGCKTTALYTLPEFAVRVMDMDEAGDVHALVADLHDAAVATRVDEELNA